MSQQEVMTDDRRARPPKQWRRGLRGALLVSAGIGLLAVTPSVAQSPPGKVFTVEDFIRQQCTSGGPTIIVKGVSNLSGRKRNTGTLSWQLPGVRNACLAFGTRTEAQLYFKVKRSISRNRYPVSWSRTDALVRLTSQNTENLDKGVGRTRTSFTLPIACRNRATLLVTVMTTTRWVNADGTVKLTGSSTADRPGDVYKVDCRTGRTDYRDGSAFDEKFTRQKVGPRRPTTPRNK